MLWLHPKEEMTEAWEYWHPDPTIAEILLHNVTISGLEAMFDIKRIARTDGYNRTGFRFFSATNRGDRFIGRLAPDPDKRRYRAPTWEPPLTTCPTCRSRFFPTRPGRIHCSDKCYRRKGRARELKDRICLLSSCAKFFRPSVVTQKYCSQACAAKMHRDRGVTRGPKTREIDTALFTELWLAGVSRRELMYRFDYSEAAIKRWVKRLALPPRLVGNHRKST